VPWRWWTGPDSDPGLRGPLQDYGAEGSYTAPEMAVHLDRSMGRPVYRRMGFQVVAEYRVFTLPTAR
jgi:hypothetical protein